MSNNAHLISFVAIGKRRIETLKILLEKPLSQREIMRNTGMYKAHTSRALSELANKKLIICINPKDRSFKFYKITSLGKRILSEVERIVNLR